MKSNLLLTCIGLTLAAKPIGPTKSNTPRKTPLWGITYNPFRANADCQTAANIDQDIKMISEVASSIRTYATGCNHEEKIFAAAAKYDIKVYQGLWVDQWGTFDLQLVELVNGIKNLSAIEKKSLAGVIVGNEAIYRKEQTVAQMVENINIVRKTLAENGITDVQVSTSDILDNYFNEELMAAIDFLIPNMHVFFDNKTMIEGIGKFWYTFDELNKFKPSSKDLFVGEIGWPEAGAPWPTSPNAIPSRETYVSFINKFACVANERKANYFFFDAFNADWKWGAADEEFHWGLGSSDRVWKSYALEALTCDLESYNYPAIQTCNGVPFDDKIYGCTDDTLLCPLPLKGCGKLGDFSCYRTDLYICVDGQIAQKQ